MWKQVYRTKSFVKHTNVRHFLSDAYKSTEAWESRLQTPILQKIQPDLFYFDLDRKFQQRGRICAVDLDILANSIKDNTMLNELSDLVHKLRLTADTCKTLASTSHAVIRHHLDHSDNDLESLVYILDDRLSYGVFFDSFTASLCLDKIIKLKNYRLAAKVSTFLMLQESFENPINRALSLYSCFKYLEDPKSFDDLVKNKQDESELANEIADAIRAADPKAKKQKRTQKKEEIRVRVSYISNPHFDNHFDLRNNYHLVGKTFLAINQHLDGAIGNSVQLLGYGFYEKYAEGNDFINSLGNSNEIHKDAITIVKKHLDQVKDGEKNENFQKFRAAIDKLDDRSASLITTSLEETIHTLVTKTVKEHEPKDIEEQSKIYNLWNQIRETKLKEELKRVEYHSRLEKIDTILEDMNEQEMKLWFFEKEDEIDVKLEKKAEREEKKESKKVVTSGKRAQKTIDDKYIPPEVEAKHN